MIKLERPLFKNIPEFTRGATYKVDISWTSLLSHIEWHTRDYALDTDPDFQRAHVWTQAQKSRFVEFMLRGGESARDIYLNCPNWNHGNADGPYVLVDGKQRLDAAVGFLTDRVSAFGWKYSQFKDVMRHSRVRFKWHVNDLDTRAEVLQWYLDLNSGGVVHTTNEIEKVRKLLEEESK